ncbi:MAG: hypothetical protein UW87_C0025G0002 [Candidatus Moranbacteria bacterium GW2011_GWC2_45_10]|nr:MAG: hypothetical protein UW87_C0025G0002 [Candidatus Moranbacteria bacterium GW2011_GWC2_45_10]
MLFWDIRRTSLLIFVFIFAMVAFAPSETYAAGLVPCGGPGENECTLCYMIVGFNGVINAALKLSFLIALAVLSFAAVAYIVSAGDSGLTGLAKSAIKSSIIGIVVMFSAWLMVNYTMHLLGTKPNLGIVNVGKWSNFQCAGQTVGTRGMAPASASPSTASQTPAVAPASPSSNNMELGEACGTNNSGKCVNTTLGACPAGTSHVWGGNDCVWGAGCCK